MARIAEKQKYFIDLFAGGGGFSLGLERAGFKSLGFVEKDPVARETLKANFGISILPSLQNCNDIQKLNPRLVKRDLTRLGFGRLDLLVASPPCQGFSMAGRSKIDSLTAFKGGHRKDPRNRLFFKTLTILSVLKPDFFLFENVPGMISIGGENTVLKLCKLINQLGYRVHASVLNAAWYGVPQSRERVVIFAARKKLGIAPQLPPKEYQLPKGHNSNTRKFFSRGNFFQTDEIELNNIREVRNPKSAITVAKAFADLPVFTEHLSAIKTGTPYLTRRTAFGEVSYKRRVPPNQFCKEMRFWNGDLVGGAKVTDHFCRWTPRDYKIFSQMKPGDCFPEAVEIANKIWSRLCTKTKQKTRKATIVPPYSTDQYEEKWKKLIPNQTSWTITAHLSRDCYSHIHFDSKQARAITLREAARLQSFPDQFVFAGHTGDVFTQIGNAVPPMMAWKIGKQIIRCLNDSKR